MMTLKHILHFLGSLPFAILLILSSALCVFAGTLLEAQTESHLYAAYYTYSNPIFIVLLWGFFVNILLSTLKRWPFKKKHIPFIITHLGLLMILGGALIKSYRGTQGSMGIIEGGGSDEILVPNSYALSIEKRDPQNPSRIIKALVPLPLKGSPFPELKLQLLEHLPHCQEQMETWTKDKRLILAGSPSIKLPPYAIEKTKDVTKTAEIAYSKAARILVTDRYSQEVLVNESLATMLGKEIALDFTNLTLTFDIAKQKIQIALDIDSSLANVNLSSPYLGGLPVAVDIQCSPTLLFLQDDQEDTYFYAFDPYGRIYSQQFKKDNLSPMMEYDLGFGGYTVQAKVPFSSKTLSRGEWEDQQAAAIVKELKDSLAQDPFLSPPLMFLKEGCDKAGVDFAETCAAFLREWNHKHCWLYPYQEPSSESVKEALGHLDWDALPNTVKAGCRLSSRVLFAIEEQLKEGSDLMDILTRMKWPLADSLQGDVDQKLTLMLQQLFAVSHLLPEYAGEDAVDARLLSAYFRLYGIHWHSIELPAYSFKDEGVALECPIHAKPMPANPSKKLEDNCPMITLKLAEKGHTDRVSLALDRYASGLKWPALQGKYRLRFQPMFTKIPYRIRLRQARQINYPNSAQPYSFESDIIITDIASGQQFEQTISMNNVYETWDGYRFYLANIAPSDEGSVKRVQIVVNHDPAKYWLTYPGCILLALGIVLLFWIRPYRRPGA